MTLQELTRLLNLQTQTGFSGESVPISNEQIISAIQSQYSPVQPLQGDAEYGANRYADWINASQPSITEYGRQLQSQAPIYSPQDFVEQQSSAKAKDLIDLLSNLGSSGNSNRYSELMTNAAGQAGLEALKSTDQASQLVGLLGMLGLPGLLLKPAIGSAEAKAANDVMTVLKAYGGEPTKDASQLVGAFQSLVPFGLLGKQDAVLAAKSLGKAFENNTQLMSGYLDAATNPDIGRIVDSLASNAESGLTPAQYGAIGASVGQDIHNAIANGMNYSDAVTNVANNLGINTIGNYGQGSTPLTNPVTPEYVPSSSYNVSQGDSGNSSSYNTYTGGNFTGTGW